MDDIKVAIMMGSKSDLPVMEETAKILKDFGVAHEIKILSAHRTPDETAEYARGLENRGAKAVICGAGGAAALAGVVAAHTMLPVIGVPMETVIHGMDSLLSTVQMPAGIPVGTVAIGKAGAKNAAFLALRIIAVSDKDVLGKLENYKEEQRKKIVSGE